MVIIDVRGLLYRYNIRLMFPFSTSPCPSSAQSVSHAAVYIRPTQHPNNKEKKPKLITNRLGLAQECRIIQKGKPAGVVHHIN